MCLNEGMTSLPDPRSHHPAGRLRVRATTGKCLTAASYHQLFHPPSIRILPRQPCTPSALLYHFVPARPRPRRRHRVCRRASPGHPTGRRQVCGREACGPADRPRSPRGLVRGGAVRRRHCRRRWTSAGGVVGDRAHRQAGHSGACVKCRAAPRRPRVKVGRRTTLARGEAAA
jgi:hypothetical protein